MQHVMILCFHDSFMTEQEVTLEMHLLIQTPHLEKLSAQRKDVSCLRLHISYWYQALAQSESLLTWGERYFSAFFFNQALWWIHFEPTPR